MIQICASTPTRNLNEAVLSAQHAIDHGCSLIEFRLDYTQTPIDLNFLTSQIQTPKIATLRPTWEGGYYKGTEKHRIDKLFDAVNRGFDYIDLEVKIPKALEIADKIRERGGKVIASFHDFTHTPDIKELKRILHSNEKIGDISKIVTTAKSFHDNLTLLNLQSSLPKRKAICFAMGRDGIPSRVLCPLHGAPFTYASTSEGLEVAPGQITVEKLTQIYTLMGVNR